MIQHFFSLVQQVKWNKKIIGFVVGSLILLLFAFFCLKQGEKNEAVVPIENGGEKEPSKGFELFDTSTWIKGEKELQVLEWRALKGQLENDLATFEAIQEARVILDIPSERLFRIGEGEAKASVIVTLSPEAHLTPSQIGAISYHLAGAVRGLKPHKIAISDTKGRVYQTTEKSDEKMVLENRVIDELDNLLKKTWGEGAFTLSCHVDDEIRVSLLFDKELQDGEVIDKHLRFLLTGYHLPFSLSLTPCEFKKIGPVEGPLEEKRSFPFISFFSSFGLVLLLLVCLLLPKKRKEFREAKGNTSIDMDKLAQSLKQEDPFTIASMLSYLSKEKGEELLEAFPLEFQQEILKARAEGQEE